MWRRVIVTAVSILIVVGLIAAAHLIDFGGVLGMIKRMHGG